jgi:hypothetical protein
LYLEKKNKISYNLNGGSNTHRCEKKKSLCLLRDPKNYDIEQKGKILSKGRNKKTEGVKLSNNFDGYN